MKTIGLLGGMSWESSAEYYRIINETIRLKLGGLHSAKCILYSVDFAEIEVLQRQDRWGESASLLVSAAQSLEAGGADCIVLCTNTMHKMAEDIQSAVHIPLLHIADATANQVKAAGLKRIGLLGTMFTMEEDFYTGRLVKTHGLDVLIPQRSERQEIHRVIYEELCLGVIRPESKVRYLEIIQNLVTAGAQGIILGCTEIELLIQPGDTPVRLFPTTSIHATAAVDFALE